MIKLSRSAVRQTLVFGITLLLGGGLLTACGGGGEEQDIVQALDATSGDLLWEYRRVLPEDVATITGTRYRYRNVSIYDDKVFLATNDAFLVALDAQTGAVVWEVQRADYLETGVAQTNGPLVVNGKLLTGSRCSSP